jgi:hypothetical protein
VKPTLTARASTASEPRDRPAFAPKALRRGLAVASGGGGSAPAKRRARTRVGESEGRSPRKRMEAPGVATVSSSFKTGENARFLVKLLMAPLSRSSPIPLGSARLPRNRPSLWRHCGGAGNLFPRPGAGRRPSSHCDAEHSDRSSGNRYSGSRSEGSVVPVAVRPAKRDQRRTNRLAIVG